jgi:hypothetical protein
MSSSKKTKLELTWIGKDVRPKLGLLYDSLGEDRVATVVKETTVLYQDLSIDIPKIVVVPKGEVVSGYQEFVLNTRNIKLQPGGTGHSHSAPA